jgi:hypothetical protein
MWARESKRVWDQMGINVLDLATRAEGLEDNSCWLLIACWLCSVERDSQTPFVVSLSSWASPQRYTSTPSSFLSVALPFGWSWWDEIKSCRSWNCERRILEELTTDCWSYSKRRDLRHFYLKAVLLIDCNSEDGKRIIRILFSKLWTLLPVLLR